jgi:hypothetical protein
MAASFSDIVAYFKNLAIKHVDIAHTANDKHFYRFEIDEVLSGLKKMNYPALILEGYSYDFKDSNADNIIKNREGRFILLGHIHDIGDFDAIHQLWDELEVIGDEIIAKIKSDKRNKLAPVVRDFNIESVEAKLIANDIDKNYGIRYSFTLGSPKALDVDPTKWSV